MKMGDPLDEATDIGTIVSPQQIDRVQGYIAIGKKTAGAVAHACSAMPTDPKLAKGLFVQPHIFTGLTNDSQLAREEIFGPVCCVIRWTDYEKVLADANDSEYGFAATRLDQQPADGDGRREPAGSRLRAGQPEPRRAAEPQLRRRQGSRAWARKRRWNRCLSTSRIRRRS